MASNSAGIGGLLPPQTTDVANYILTTDGQTASWEVSSASLPSQVGNSGKYLTTDGSVASWATVSASGVTTMAAVGSSPSANGASISGATLTLQPADATHPGVVTAAAQAIAGVKTFSSQVECTGDLTTAAAFSAVIGTSFGGAFAGLGYAGVGVGTIFCYTDGTNVGINTPGAAGNVVIKNQFGGQPYNLTPTSLDMSGMGAGGSIKLKSPDGTTYTITVANGGTWSIV